MSMLHDSADLRHDDFLARLQTIQKHASYVFRKRPHHERQDSVDEAVAAAWKLWVGIVRKGSDPTAVTATALAHWAVGHVLKGRRIAKRGEGGRGNMDVFHPRSNHKVSPLEGLGETWQEWFLSDRRAGIPEIVATKLDFETWLASRSPRDKAVFLMLALGATTTEVADHFGVTLGRISQLRAEAKRAWDAYSGS